MTGAQITFLILGILLLLSLIGGLIYWYIASRKKKSDDPTPSPDPASTIDWSTLTSYCVKTADKPIRMYIDKGHTTCDGLGWTTAFTFKAFSSSQPGTQQICLFTKDNNESIVAIGSNCSVTPDGWKSYLSFYAYNTQIDSTVPLCVRSDSTNSGGSFIDNGDCKIVTGYTTVGTFYAYPATYTHPSS